MQAAYSRPIWAEASWYPIELDVYSSLVDMLPVTEDNNRNVLHETTLYPFMSNSVFIRQ